MNSTHDIGKKAEDAAVNFLSNLGYEVLDRNWHWQHYEIDIVAQKNGIVVFIEVKSLSSNAIKEPYVSVNQNKQMMLISAANAYIRRQNIMDEIRFDVISIVLSPLGDKIEHIENAFYPRVGKHYGH